MQPCTPQTQPWSCSNVSPERTFSHRTSSPPSQLRSTENTQVAKVVSSFRTENRQKLTSTKTAQRLPHMRSQTRNVKEKYRHIFRYSSLASQNSISTCTSRSSSNASRSFSLHILGFYEIHDAFRSFITKVLVYSVVQHVPVAVGKWWLPPATLNSRRVTELKLFANRRLPKRQLVALLFGALHIGISMNPMTNVDSHTPRLHITLGQHCIPITFLQRPLDPCFLRLFGEVPCSVFSLIACTLARVLQLLLLPSSPSRVTLLLATFVI